MKTFVLELKFDKNNERRLEIRPAHRAFLARLYEEGTLVMAGPLADDSGAIQVLQAESLDHLETVLAADPNSIEGVVTRVSVREWVTIFPPT
jgi:uncharacterized protein